MQIKKMVRAFKSRLSGVSALCFVVFMPVLNAATLDVDLAVSHGVYTKGELATSRSVVYLVIDRSGSMAEKTLKDGRSPDEALLESLKMQLDAIQLGTEVRILPFSNQIGEETLFKSLAEADRKSILELVKKMTPKGQTLLYDAQDMALTAAAKIMESDANADVRVLVYTDGEHLTPWNYEGEYKARYQLNKGGRGRRRFVENPAYQEERAAARKKFEEKFSDLIANPNLEVEYEWLSASPPPDWAPDCRTVIFPVLASHTPELCNPLEHSDQAFRGALHLPISDKCWEEVRGKPFTVEWRIGDKKASGTLKLDSGHQKCSVEWPSLPADNPEKALLTVKNLPGGRKFVLKDAKPVLYEIPAFRRGVEIVETANKYYEIGKETTFSAKGIGKVLGYAWMVDGKEVAGGAETLKHVFADAKSHEIGVTARYVNGLTATAKRSVLVWPTPAVRIVSPEEYDGDPESAMLRAGNPITLNAKVEGAFESVVWSFEQDGTVVDKVSASVKDGIVASSHVLAKGGLYDVTVTAEGQAGKISETVQIYLKPKAR